MPKKARISFGRSMPKIDEKKYEISKNVYICDR